MICESCKRKTTSAEEIRSQSKKRTLSSLSSKNIKRIKVMYKSSKSKPNLRRSKSSSNRSKFKFKSRIQVSKFKSNKPSSQQIKFLTNLEVQNSSHMAPYLQTLKSLIIGFCNSTVTRRSIFTIFTISIFLIHEIYRTNITIQLNQVGALQAKIQNYVYKHGMLNCRDYTDPDFFNRVY